VLRFEMLSTMFYLCCSLTTLSDAPTPEDRTESHSSDANQCSLDLHRRSVTVPSSLADSAISLSTTESSAVLSCGSKNRSDDVANESPQVLHDSPPLGFTPPKDDAPTGTMGKDKRKKIGLSRLIRGKQKEL